MTPLKNSPASIRTVTSRVARFSFIRYALFGLCLISLAACGDLPTSTGSIDRIDAAHILPAVADARIRLSQGITNVNTRQRLIVGMAELEMALRSGDGSKARVQLSSLTNTLGEYRSQSSIGDGADVTAILLMLDVVSKTVNAG